MSKLTPNIDTSRIAIQILNYKNIQTTIKLLESLNSMTDSKFNIFILDNGSGDEIYNNFKKKLNFSNLNIKLLYSDKNIGFTAGHNLLSKYILKMDFIFDYFLYLNSDCLLENKFFNKLTASNKLKGNVNYLFGFSTFTLSNFKYSHTFGFWNKYTGLSSTKKYISPRLLRYGIYYPTGNALLLKRSIFYEIGFLDEDLFFYGDEVDLVLRLKNKNLKFHIFKNIKTFHDDGGSVKRNGERYTAFSDFHSIRSSLLLIYKYFPNNIIYAKFFVFLVFFKRLIFGYVNNSFVILKLIFSNYKSLLKYRDKYAKH
jgi:GT2 family glycosyltransferase